MNQRQPRISEEQARELWQRALELQNAAEGSKPDPHALISADKNDLLFAIRPEGEGTRVRLRIPLFRRGVNLTLLGGASGLAGFGGMTIGGGRVADRRGRRCGRRNGAHRNRRCRCSARCRSISLPVSLGRGWWPRLRATVAASRRSRSRVSPCGRACEMIRHMNEPYARQTTLHNGCTLAGLPLAMVRR